MSRIKVMLAACTVLTTGPALADDPHYGWIDLAMPSESVVVAHITHPYGIERVVRETTNSLGQIQRTQVDGDCADSVEMRWRRTETKAKMHVRPCSHPNADASDFASFDSIDGAFLDEYFEVAFADTDRDGLPETPIVQFKPVHHLAFAINPGTSKLEDIECYSVVACLSMADYCDENGGHGTCYDDYCVCDLP